MPRIIIDHKIVINYDFTSRDKYWGALSTHLIETHGKGHYKEQQKVEEVLLDGFQFLCDCFRQIILAETKFTFFLYIHWLHEQSIEIYKKTLGGFKIEAISDSEFAMYRRVLKLILEQGCDINFRMGWNAKWK